MLWLAAGELAQRQAQRSFQLKAGLHCSKSPVFNCFRCKAAGQPANARGSGRFSEATGGRLMQRSQPLGALAARRPIFTGAVLILLVTGNAGVASAQVTTCS